MIEVRYDKEMLLKARQRGKRLGKLKNSHTGGRSNEFGMLGEMIVEKYTGCKICDRRDYDIIVNGLKLEVKTKKTKDRSAPRPHFECSVAASNTRQRCDAYVFVRVSTTSNKAWICGMKKKNRFFKEAHFCRKGDRDGNYVHVADSYNIAMKKLSKFKL